MKALRWHSRLDLRLDIVPDPAPPRDHELVLEVLAAGICGTDIEEWTRGPHNVPTTPHPLSGRCAPITLGHETVGRVVAAGASATLELGAVVAVEANTSCGVCAPCLRGDTQLCGLLSSKGLHDDGGLAEYLTVPESMCCEIPKTISALTAVFAEPLAVAVRACARGGVMPGSHVTVFGGGTVGQLVAQVSRLRGAQVVVVEPLVARREIARALGTERAVDPSSVEQFVDELTEGIGADIAIECSGTSAAIATASAITRPGGTLVLVGVSDIALPLSPLDLILREQTVTASLSHVMADFREALHLLTIGAVEVGPLLSDVVPLSAAVESGFAPLRDDPDNHVKVVVVPDVQLPSHDDAHDSEQRSYE